MASPEQIQTAKNLLVSGGFNFKDFDLEGMSMTECGQLISNLMAHREPMYGITPREYSSPGERVFEEEINWILTEEVKQIVLEVFTRVPPYFYEIPASSTGKYHPRFSLGIGGLVRHTKCAVAICYSLVTHPMCEFSQEDKDCCLAALILHDTCKDGLPPKTSKYTVTEHPLLVRELFANHKIFYNEPYSSLCKKILSLIETHMGPWTKDYRSKREVLKRPETELQKFVHMCDYISSRKIWDPLYPNSSSI